MSDNGRVVEGEVVGGSPEPPRRPSAGQSFFHPLSGAVILGIDWVAFGMDLFSGFAALALVSLAAFAAAFYSVLRIQRGLRGDAPGAALRKALLGGLAAGLPFPVAGTILGAVILALSGLPQKRL